MSARTLVLANAHAGYRVAVASTWQTDWLSTMGLSLRRVPAEVVKSSFGAYVVLVCCRVLAMWIRCSLVKPTIVQIRVNVRRLSVIEVSRMPHGV